MVAVSTAIVGYVFFLLTTVAGSRQRNIPENDFIRKGRISAVLWMRASGFLFFGVLPFFAVIVIFHYRISSLGISLSGIENSLYWGLGLSVIIIPVSFMNAKNPKLQKKYPQMRTKTWTVGLLVISATSWIFYLLAYEFLLRGFLFFSSLEAAGLGVALIINVVVYTVFHIHKGKKEMAGAVIFGCGLCLVTFATKSIWAAWLIHVALALSSEWAFIHHHPLMEIRGFSPR